MIDGRARTAESALLTGGAVPSPHTGTKVTTGLDRHQVRRVAYPHQDQLHRVGRDHEDQAPGAAHVGGDPVR
jgi:hypothetical protein